jgi:alkanesulfonate monooxygenase SsuD/methylene tetrahydromethanopterin reductase-like flavin-dependent oxidoreductase (luciferase family)
VLSHAKVIRYVVNEAVLADELGFDCFGVGEHHRHDFAVSLTDLRNRLELIRPAMLQIVIGKHVGNSGKATSRCGSESAPNADGRQPSN